jgi:hypothetical protein
MSDPKTLDEALDRVPYLADLAGVPRSEMRRLVVTTWPEWARVKEVADPANFKAHGPAPVDLPRDAACDNPACSYRGEVMSMAPDCVGNGCQLRYLEETANELARILALEAMEIINGADHAKVADRMLGHPAVQAWITSQDD